MSEQVPKEGEVYSSLEELIDFSAKSTLSVDRISLRDWFAGMAMQGMMGDSECPFNTKEVCETAYDVADRMLGERKKKNPV